MNYDLNTYIAITLAPGSSLSRSPVSLASVHPALAHMGQVGELIDVQLVSVTLLEMIFWLRYGLGLQKVLSVWRFSSPGSESNEVETNCEMGSIARNSDSFSIGA
ncbi:hypothetical protein E1B28_009130 [Marasmius oreades]|uniref:Uncharacterized protein n=1 Tax=Marasmius oreades TaxID=181124 RepID=A0A9P7RZR9_9AGAR|nr:uncharacterized protein E1B28_009130 [Marasmius oreades]KAG7092814.1 hypothetical protein E1B28_009130 [Marasmius oreades]